MLDKHVTEIMLRSENKLCPGETPFEYSGALERQMRIVRLIKRLKEQAHKNFPLETYINQELEDVAVELLRMDDNTMESTLTQERQKLHEMQDSAWEIRQTHQKDIQECAASEQNKEVEQIVRVQRHREIQKRTFERIGYTLRTSSYAQLTRLGLPKHLFHESTEVIWEYIQRSTDEELKSIEWEYTEDLQEIERRLLEWNIHHFNQAHKSPLATPHWQKKLDPIHKSDEELEDILNHTLLEGEDLSAETICLLEQISNNLQAMMDTKRTQITEEHFRSFYKCTPEDKSASPSGLHLGYYKSAASNETFSFVLWSILHMAYTNPFCLDRWKLSATTRLENIPWFPKIHKFRTIHIIESDLDFVMRLIWGREFMAHNEANDGFHDNQYGGRKGRQPQPAILNKVLTLDVVRYQAEEAGLLDNDAKACYDRVLPYLTAYMLRRLGMPYFLSNLCV